MAALAANGGSGGPGRKRSPVTLGHVAIVGGIVLVGFVLWSLLGAEIVTERPNEMKTTQVILPPPPPPPPPEPIEQVKPPEPTDAPAIDDPVDAPPPPDQAQQPSPSAESAPGDNALTAREGAGPTGYGLAAGDGSGGRIGGRPGGSGGNGFAAYASVALTAIRVATQADRELARGRYGAQLSVTVDAEGRITAVRILQGSGDSRRDERLRRLLTGLQLSRKPPAGLPAMRIELTSRAGA